MLRSTAIFLSNRNSAWLRGISKNAFGSSSNKTFTCCATASAKNTRLRSPSLNSAIGRFAKFTTSKSAIDSSTMRLSSSVRLSKIPEYGERPKRTNSLTLMRGGTALDIRTSDIIFARSRGNHSASGFPPSETVPATGESKPANVFKSELLPHPFSPINATTVPGVSEKSNGTFIVESALP